MVHIIIHPLLKGFVACFRTCYFIGASHTHSKGTKKISHFQMWMVMTFIALEEIKITKLCIRVLDKIHKEGLTRNRASERQQAAPKLMFCEAQQERSLT